MMPGIFRKIKLRLQRKEIAEKAPSVSLSPQTVSGGGDAEPEKPGKLLVVGNESDFSDEVITYALDMAQRLSYDILALNTAPLSCETFKLFSSSRNQICRDFQNLSEEHARRFAEMAEKKKIAFEHVVKFSETDRAIDEIRRQKGAIEFVIADPEEERTEVRPENTARLRREICVYAMR